MIVGGVRPRDRFSASTIATAIALGLAIAGSITATGTISGTDLGLAVQPSP